jgi:Protein of unknown function (DUF3147)
VEEILLRIIVGGFAVSAFALLGDLLRPKSFAGLLGAGPSVALATLILTATKEGSGYVSVEARSMILGALASIFYATVVSQVLIRWQASVVYVASLAMMAWFAAAFGLWYAMVRMAG